MKKNYSLFLLFLFIVSCKGQDTTKTLGNSIASDPESDIVSVALKDKNGNIWFAASGRGVYRYDARLNDAIGQEKSFTNFTEKDGLNSNFPIATNDSNNAYSSKDYSSEIPKQVVSILQDKAGN